MDHKDEIVSLTTGVVLAEETVLSLTEMCRQFAVEAEWIRSLVEEGILDPLGQKPAEWRFTGESCRRIGVVLRLQRDFDVNLSGAALVLDLLEEVETLRVQLETEIK